MELIVGSDESELAVPGRECDVPGRASCWANGMGLASRARSSNKRGVSMDVHETFRSQFNTPAWFEYVVVSAAAPARRSEKVGLLARVG